MQYRFSAEEMCDCFGLSRGGCYDWNRRVASRRAEEDAAHKSRISEFYRQSKVPNGNRPIYHHLVEEGIGTTVAVRPGMAVGYDLSEKRGRLVLFSDGNRSLQPTNHRVELFRAE